ncbi:MAG: DNA polymerase III subunit gamma/tau [Gammaproteobacteria bacterium]
MSYQVLARRWRPKTFQAMTGQAHILQALNNALTQQRLHHAYLFSGARGIGKTTIARILAKALNCQQGISPQPCEQCPACIAINDGSFVDLIEVDAASKTKVEDTRELLDNVQYLPAQGRFKIYIIDEVHMLSTHSFNALLKTLEEPPAHIKFLLATTDPQKLPATVLSRCLQFHLTKIQIEEISAHLQVILKAEEIQYEHEALNIIAQAADGSVRDALSLLDQAIIYCSEKISTVQTRKILGFIEQTHIVNLLDAIVTHSASQCIDIIQQLATQAADFNQALQDLLSLLHHIALAQALPAAINEHIIQHKKIHQFAKTILPENVQLFYQIALTGRQHLPLAPTPKSGFEMLVLRMLAFQPASVTQDRPPHIPTATAPTTTPVTTKAPMAEHVPTTENHTVATTTDWSILIEQLNLSGMSKLLAEHCTLKLWQDKEITLQLAASHVPLLTENLQAQLAQALSQHLNRKITLHVDIAKGSIDSPAKKKQNQAESIIHGDVNVKTIIDQFNATIVPGSTRLKNTVAT